MADIWGMLPKAQDNNQTIAEAIAEAITAHNADYTAHSGAGQSIDVHRNSEVIDHLADSIVADKLLAGQISLAKMSQTRMFSQIDLNILNNVTYFSDSWGNAFYGEISNGASTNTWYGGYFGGDQMNAFLGAKQFSPTFRMRVVSNDGIYGKVFFGIGDIDTDQNLGFYFDGATVKSQWCSTYPSTIRDTIAGYDATEVHNYSVEVHYNEAILWLIDGVVVKTLSWPVTLQLEPGNIGLSIYNKRTGGYASSLVIYQAFFEQDFF
jgi:hypothetical protein